MPAHSTLIIANKPVKPSNHRRMVRDIESNSTHIINIKAMPITADMIAKV